MSVDPGLAAGRLLVATPMLVDPNFDHTVVLLLDMDDTGALGVVLNRPSDVPVHTILPQWRNRIPSPDVLFSGGPVATDSALAVGYVRDETEEPVGFRHVHGGLGVVDLDTPTELLTDVVAGMRVFAGYAGWGPEQLQAEVVEGSWFVFDSDPRDVFSDTPEGLWSTVLRRQPGELAWLSTMPMDPTQN